MFRIKELRKERHLSQAALAIKLNISQSSISDFEKGKRTPDIKFLIAVSKLFNVSLDYLAGLTDIKRIIQKSDLSTDEIEHLLQYRQLNQVEKEKIKAFIAGLQSK